MTYRTKHQRIDARKKVGSSLAAVTDGGQGNANKVTSCRPTHRDSSPKPGPQKHLDVPSSVNLVATVFGVAVVETVGLLSRKATQAAECERPPPRYLVENCMRCWVAVVGGVLL